MDARVQQQCGSLENDYQRCRSGSATGKVRDEDEEKVECLHPRRLWATGGVLQRAVRAEEIR